MTTAPAITGIADHEEQHRLAIRRGTVNVVLCRLRYRLEQFAPREAVPDAAARSSGKAQEC